MGGSLTIDFILHCSCLHKCVFVVMENTWIDSLPHYLFDAFSARSFENTRIERCEVS